MILDREAEMDMHNDQAAPEDSRVSLASRRDLIKGGLAGVAAGLAAVGSQANALAPSALGATMKAFADGHELKPLPFDTSKLRGLSRRLIESHWSNNYGGSVRALNIVNKRLNAALGDPDMQPYIYNDLKREHLMRTGSVVLHELYFDNLGGDGVAPADVRSLIARAFGSYDRWESEYRRIASGLGGGSGWVVFGYNTQLRALENYWMADHLHSPVSTAPLLVLDMYEHSYHMHYGAAAGRYVDAFFRNINWDSVGARVAHVLGDGNG